jgi:cobalt transporter subunit CbtA
VSLTTPMVVFRSIVFCRSSFAAVLSGLLVASFATIAQHIAIVPLIVQAEVCEQQAHNEQHEDEGWQPANGFERNAYTALFNLVDWIGFALLLNGALVLMHRPVTWREGYLWGLGAFVAFVIAPGLGLPPEPTAPLLPRQLWWTATVMATACDRLLSLQQPSC